MSAWDYAALALLGLPAIVVGLYLVAQLANALIDRVLGALPDDYPDGGDD